MLKLRESLHYKRQRAPGGVPMHVLRYPDSGSEFVRMFPTTYKPSAMPVQSKIDRCTISNVLRFVHTRGTGKSVREQACLRSHREHNASPSLSSMPSNLNVNDPSQMMFLNAARTVVGENALLQLLGDSGLRSKAIDRRKSFMLGRPSSGTGRSEKQLALTDGHVDDTEEDDQSEAEITYGGKTAAGKTKRLPFFLVSTLCSIESLILSFEDVCVCVHAR